MEKKAEVEARKADNAAKAKSFIPPELAGDLAKAAPKAAAVEVQKLSDSDDVSAPLPRFKSSVPEPQVPQATVQRPTLNIGGSIITLDGFDGEEDNFYEKDLQYPQMEEQIDESIFES